MTTGLAAAGLGWIFEPRETTGWSTPLLGATISLAPLGS